MEEATTAPQEVFSFTPVDVEARQIAKVTGAIELKPFGTVFSQIQVTQIHLKQTWVRVVTWQIANLLKTLKKGEKVVMVDNCWQKEKTLEIPVPKL